MFCKGIADYFPHNLLSPTFEIVHNASMGKKKEWCDGEKFTLIKQWIKKGRIRKPKTGSQKKLHSYKISVFQLETVNSKLFYSYQNCPLLSLICLGGYTSKTFDEESIFNYFCKCGKDNLFFRSSFRLDFMFPTRLKFVLCLKKLYLIPARVRKRAERINKIIG